MPATVTNDYERTDVGPWLIGALAVGVASFLALTPLALMLAYPDALRVPVQGPSIAAVPAPRLQLDPAAELAEFRREEAARLSGYAWIDPNRQVVSVPIDRAMSLLAQRGLPGWRRP